MKLDGKYIICVCMRIFTIGNLVFKWVMSIFSLPYFIYAKLTKKLNYRKKPTYR